MASINGAQLGAARFVSENPAGGAVAGQRANGSIVNLLAADAATGDTVHGAFGPGGGHVFQDGNGAVVASLDHKLGSGYDLRALATPGAPAVSPQGTAGTTSYTYYVIAKDRNGKRTTASAAGSTTTGNATLSATNFNRISWTAVPGAVSYDVLKGNTSTLLGSTPDTQINDTGQGTTTYTPPTRNETADLTVGGEVSGRLDATQVNRGTLADARLSANVPLRNAGNTFTARQTVERITVGDSLFAGRVAGEAFDRVIIDSSAVIRLGSGAAVADTILYRYAADHLRTDDNFSVGGSVGLGTTNPGTHRLYVNGGARLGNFAVGADAGTAVGANLRPQTSGGTTQYGAILFPVLSSDATGAGYGLYVTARTAAATYTMGSFYGIRVPNLTVGTGSTVTNNYALYIDAQTAGTTNWSIYSAGGNSYHAGSFWIGTTNGGTHRLYVSGTTLVSSSLVIGTAALATTATDGFLYIPSSAGAPTGTPTAYTGRVPLHYDSTNNRLYIYNGAWRSVALA